MSVERSRFRWRSELAGLLELMAASGLAFAQPLFDLLATNTDLFIGRRISPLQLVGFAVAVVIGPPLVLAAVEFLVGVVAPRLRRLLHWSLLAVLGGLIAVEAIKAGTQFSAHALVAIGSGVALAVGLLVARVAVVRSWLRVLAIAPLVFGVLFVAGSPVTSMVFDTNSAAADVSISHPHRVVWVVFDEFPVSSLLDGQGGVDATLFPNFARLAATSNWYRNSTSIAPFTLAAVPGMLTSTYPDDINAAATAATYPDNLFTLLGDSYDVNAYETLTVMCPEGICDDARHVVPRSGGLGGLARDGINLWREFASPRRTAPGLDLARGTLAIDPEPLATAQSFVGSLQPTSRPQLDFLHVFLPHWPWRYAGAAAQDTGERGNPPGLDGGRWGSAWAARSGRERHLLQVQATDSLLGSIVARLGEIGAWDDSLVVVTADHGVGFAPGDPPRGLSAADAPDLVWTPLFVKLPGQTTALVDDRPARAVDILPTVAEILGVRLPWQASGVSLLGRPRVDGPVKVLRWEYDVTRATDGRFNVVDGPEGFARVLRRRAADGPDRDLALFRTGPFAALVGRDAGPLIDETRSTARVSVTDRDRFGAVVPDAAVAPWLRAAGAVIAERDNLPLAVVVNGVVAAVTQSVRGADPHVSPWWAVLPPQFFRAGSNDVAVFEIVGSPSAPGLRAAS